MLWVAEPPEYHGRLAWQQNAVYTEPQSSVAVPLSPGLSGFSAPFQLSQYDRTPLHCAARSGSVEVVKALLYKGANIGATEKVRDALSHTPRTERVASDSGSRLQRTHTPICCPAALRSTR